MLAKGKLNAAKGDREVTAELVARLLEVLPLHNAAIGPSEDRMAAGAMLTAIFSHAADRSGLKAD